MGKNYDNLISFKIWLKGRKGPILGKGGASILEAIKEYGSISKAAEKLNMSYKYVWDYISRIEKITGKTIVKTYRGGVGGGGKAELTKDGIKLLRMFRRMEDKFTETVKDVSWYGIEDLRLSARNKVDGIVKEVKDVGGVVTVKVKIKTPITLTAILTREAVEDLKIKVGDSVKALIKATNIMLAKL